MKKILLTVLSVCLVLLCLISVCSCNQEADTAAPSRFKLDTDTLILKWNAVSDARSYEVRVSGDERIKTIKATSYSLEYLDPGTYTIEVRALNVNAELEASAWASYTFERESESGLAFNLINNNTEYEVVGTGTAYGDVVMESVYRGKPVTSIADKAFANNKKITSLIIGDNVKTIGKNAFSKSSVLVSITIPDSVTSIGDYAFQSCKQLTGITLPDSVGAISDYMFSWCTSLQSVTIGAGVESIGENAFSSCNALVSVTIPDSVKTIGEYAFSDCSRLASVTLGNGMESISNYAFYNCAALESLDLGQSLSEIGTGAFGRNDALTTIVIPDSVSVIGSEAFAECENLANITLGSGVKQIGSYAFYGTVPHTSCEDDVLYLNGWLIEAVDRQVTGISLKDGTYAIADGAFQSCSKLEKITIRGVKYIGQAAFANCTSLYQVNADDSLLEINDYAFYNCTILAKVNVGSGLVKIGSYSFQNCTALTDDGIDLPQTVSSIGGYAFYGSGAFARATSQDPVVYIDDWAVGIKQGGIYMSQIDIKEGTRAISNYAFTDTLFMGNGILFPSTLSYIGRGAFYNCYMAGGFGGGANLEYIDDYAFYGCSSAWFFASANEPGVTQFPSKLKHIGRSAFYQCTAMIGLKIPAMVEYIGPYAFYGCTNLGDSGVVYASVEAMKNGDPTLKGPIIIQEGVKYIGDGAFQGCTGIVEVNLPKSLEYLGTRAFYNCTKLESVSFGDGTVALDIPDYTFYKCENLTNLVISQNIKSIGKCAFKGCSSLENIIMGEQMESIGDYAFYGCTGVKEIYISDSVRYIGSYAFKGCVRVDSVVIPSDVETIGKHAFYGLNTATFFCESDTINPYWNERWNSSYRAVLWGCVLSEDKTYVVSFVKNAEAYDNLSAPDATLAPEREGYTFAGWATEPESEEVVYTADKLSEIPDGTALYAVWNEATTD